MNFDDYAQPWQKKKKDDFRLPIRSNNPYFYKHHPNNWDLVMMKKGKKNRSGLVATCNHSLVNRRRERCPNAGKRLRRYTCKSTFEG